MATSDTDPTTDEEWEARHKACFEPKYERDEDTFLGWGRTQALRRWTREHGVPVEDYDGRLITDIEFDRTEGQYFIKSLTKVVKRDCPDCGHDRAEKTTWDIGPEQGMHVDCMACGHVIESEDTF